MSAQTLKKGLSTPNSPSPRTAIITGSSRGIGKAVATRLAADGFAAVVNYASKAKEADEVVAVIERAGGQAIAVQANVADAKAAARLFEAANEAFGGVDVVVNNAGVIDIKPVGEFSEAEFDRLIAINVKGTFNMLRLAAKRLRDGGRIINFSTSALATALPGYAIYNASKAAVEAITRVMAKELGARGITVNAVAPGPVATELFFQGKTQELVDRLITMTPLGRLGETADIAPVVSFLAGPGGAWISGQTLRANGGIG